MSKELKKAVKKANKGKLGKVTLGKISLGELNKVSSKLNEDVSVKVKPAKEGFKIVFVDGVLEAEPLSKKELKKLTKAIKKEKKSIELALNDAISLASVNSLLEEFDEISKVKFDISEGETVLKIKFSYDEAGNEEEILVEERIVIEDEISDKAGSTCTGNCGSCNCDEDDKEEDEDEEVIHLPTETVETPKPSKKEKKKNKKHRR